MDYSLLQQFLSNSVQPTSMVGEIPSFLATSGVSGDFHYQEHYQKDAEEFDYFEERGSGTLHEEERVQQMILYKIPPTTTSVLDVGCGRAWVARDCLPKGMLVCSMDISAANPTKALKHYPAAKHIACIADAFRLPFATGVFDCIIASEIIEHVPHPAEFVHELMRVLKPGGKLILSTPYNEKIRYVLCIHCNNITPVHAHIHSFTEKTLSSLYTAADCKRCTWTIFGNKALIHLRTHVLLRHLPFALWRMVDSLANFILNKCAHIVVEWEKQ